ncbi:uncharacterized protein LOC116989977 [Amblyraja radiata]|uniref:uncharacterized protein LOC116989977 n=1 Tax=Amblyraja radiata TaxID=386614 RepID=UPI00140307FE|nr:uncharacterized protein LOC116989977 [Amblyraja radiata]
MSECLQLATLGRPFQLGMLYDCRSDALIPGITLWDLQTLQSNLDRRDQPSTEFHIIASDSMEKKANALNVSGSLKVSFLAGLVEVKGSAKYLRDTKESKQQAGVTLQYKATTRFEQLTMSHLGIQNITYPSVFDEGSATHVITAVLYGAQAFFVFDRMTSSTENTQDIQGNMEAMIKLLPQIAIQGEASLEMTEEQKSHAEKFSCTFYGDFSLKNNPTTFKDAINIYATLPNLLGPDGEHSVPITVWLYPLNKLDSKAAQLVREISVGLVNRCQDVLEQLNEAAMRCNDLMKDSVAVQFPEIGDRILQFREKCLEYKLVFQGTLARVLPSIRGGGKEEGLLADILKNREQSPFKHQALTTWLDDKAREMKVVGSYLSILKDIPVVKSESELDDMDLATVYVVCFTFTTLHHEDLYLSEANIYLQSPTAQKMETQPPADGACTQRQSDFWFNLPSVSQQMRELSGSFLEFATANIADGKIKFAVGSVRDDSNIGAFIYLYDRGCLENQCFVPPSQPEIPTSSRTTHDSVTLHLQPPTFGTGEIVGYKVEYRGSQQEEWIILDTPDQCHSFTISGLLPHQEYHFRYRAVTKVGVSKASEIYNVSTRPISHPGKPVFQDQSPSPTLSGDGPSQNEVFHYRKEYKEEPSMDALDGSWEQLQTKDRQCHDSSDGPKRIALKLLEQAQLISRGNPSIYKLNLEREVFNQSKQLVKCSLGKPTTTHKMKTIMLLGATGSGKTTLINGMINYILGVEWGDNFRYQLIQEETGKSQAESQTSSITAYHLHHQVGFNIDCSLTIIDTPGFGDTRGISRDRQITDHIREFFTSPQGVDQIDAVCFIVQASLARLTPTQKYVFDSILSIFGKDVAENIQILLTFADGQRPPVLEALKAAQVPCSKDKKGLPVHFKFNNCAIYAQRPTSGDEGRSDDSGEEDDDFDQMFWMMGTNSMKKFFTALSTMQARSLCLTKEVLKERSQLESVVAGLQPLIQAGLTKYEELKKTQQVLDQNQSNLEENKDFEYEVDVTVKEKRKLGSNAPLVNNCTVCEYSCHDPCTYAVYIFKYWCSSMDGWGNCKVCPGKCSVLKHMREKYRYVCVTKKEKRTYNELKEKYEKAYGEMSQQKVMELLEQECTEVGNTVLELIQELSQGIRRLEEIALRANPLSTPAYIALLIQAEKDEGKPGYIERIQALTAVKKEAEVREQIANNEKLSPEYSEEGAAGGKSTGEKLKKKMPNPGSDPGARRRKQCRTTTIPDSPSVPIDGWFSAIAGPQPLASPPNPGHVSYRRRRFFTLNDVGERPRGSGDRWPLAARGAAVTAPPITWRAWDGAAVTVPPPIT